jgi:hypothetical protein
MAADARLETARKANDIPAMQRALAELTMLLRIQFGMMPA